jgi:hypothetical protein
MGEDLELLKAIVEMADKQFDGHLTVMKFTTNWRVGFQTPAGREDIDKMPSGDTFAEAARNALLSAAVHPKP